VDDERGSEQVFFDQRGWTRSVVRRGGGRVHLRIADERRGRDGGGRDRDTVVVPGHVLRTVRGDDGRGGDHGRGRGHVRSG